MSVLVDRDVESCIKSGSIVITPYDRKHLGTNSYDVHLADMLKVYTDPDEPLDAREPRETMELPIGEHGRVLYPEELYLASTIEYTESHDHLPILNGKSSLGRLGLSIHVTAGTGDVGFKGYWTMELFVIRPLRVYPGMAIGQLLWFTASDRPEVPYHSKSTAKYGGLDPFPQGSLMHREREV